MRLPWISSLLKLKWDIKVLSVESLDEIQEFIQLFDDFFKLCEGEEGSAKDILSACPPSKNKSEDKFVLGIYDHTILIGILDIIRDYPKKGTWTIGYLLIHPKYRNQGIGFSVIKNLRLSLPNIALRCVVQEQNVKALNFWKSSGFRIVKQIKEKLANKINITYILESKNLVAGVSLRK